MNVRKLFIAALGAATLATVATSSLAGYSRAGDSAVSFTATGPGGLKIVGKGKDISVNDDDRNVTIVVPLAQFDTGIELRNKHMKEKYLEVAKYPNAELVVAKSDIPAAGGEGDASGTMKIHGQSKPVRFHYKVAKNGDKLGVTGTTRVSLTDFGIEEPSFMGAKVRPEVDVTATFGVK
jgi:polyisoprenoid-binding protein YceI